MGSRRKNPPGALRSVLPVQRASIVVVAPVAANREALAAALGAAGLTIAASFGSSASLAEVLTEGATDAVVLVDVSGRDALELLCASLESGCDRVLAYGIPADGDIALACIQLGSLGLIDDDTSLDGLVEAVNAVAAGERVYSPRLIETVASCVASSQLAGSAISPGWWSLTTREREVARLAADGLPNKEIARSLHITVGTVKAHVHSVLAKLGLEHRHEIPAVAPAGDRRRQRLSTLRLVHRSRM